MQRWVPTWVNGQPGSDCAACMCAAMGRTGTVLGSATSILLRGDREMHCIHILSFRTTCDLVHCQSNQMFMAWSWAYYPKHYMPVINIESYGIKLNIQSYGTKWWRMMSMMLWPGFMWGYSIHAHNHFRSALYFCQLEKIYSDWKKSFLKNSETIVRLVFGNL
jgi:hypothetical protein